MWWLGVAVATAAVCPDDPAEVAVDEARAMVEAFDRLDQRGFDQAHRSLDHALGCLDVPLAPAPSVEVHTAKALGAFVEGEAKAVERSWAAVKVLDPSARPASRWGESHPLRTAFDEAAVDDERVSLEREPDGGWVVDGEARSDVPAQRAFLLQGLGPEGLVLHSGYHYSVAEVPQIDFAELDPTARQRRRKRIHVLGTTLASTLGVGALTTATMTVVSRARIADEETPYEDIEGLRVTANTAGNLAAGLTLGAATVACATWTINW